MSTPNANILKTWISLEAIAKDRFDAYRRPGDADELDAIARYVWAIEVAKSLQPKLHALEITFRNRVHNALSMLHGPNWYDLATLMTSDDLSKVAAAKQNLKFLRKPENPGRIVAELSFGFWTSLYGKNHEHDVVRPTIHNVFPLYSGPQKLQRSVVASRLRDARFLRNRISHLEHVAFDVKLPSIHAEACEMISWMNTEMGVLSDIGDDFLAVYGKTWKAFRPVVETLFS